MNKIYLINILTILISCYGLSKSITYNVPELDCIQTFAALLFIIGFPIMIINVLFCSIIMGAHI